MGVAGLQALGPMIGALGGPVLSSLFAPEGQELSSFEGYGEIDPVTMLQNANALIGNAGRGIAERAATPISLPSAYVQSTPVFTGGGLPMPIGLTGSDPALVNPSLLNLQGMGQFQNLFSGVGTGPSYGSTTGASAFTPPGAGMTGADSIMPGSDIDPDGPLGADAPMGENAFRDFYQPAFDQGMDASSGWAERQTPSESRSSVTQRRQPASLVRGADLLAEDAQVDDLDRAQAAVKLLLQNL